MAPHVNRKTIKKRSPDARLAGRLFLSDKIVRPFIGDAAEDFFVEAKKQWGWNSRYWEQRALLFSESNLDLAIRYARQGVAIEYHPFPLTTLSKLLLMQMETASCEIKPVFDEAYKNLSEAIDSAAQRSRTSVHPFSQIIIGTSRYLELGGKLTPQQCAQIRDYVYKARYHFRVDLTIKDSIRQLESMMSL